MCSTPWCYGDCEECEARKQSEKDFEEMNAQCPHRKECNLVTVDVKTDTCTYCGKIFTY